MRLLANLRRRAAHRRQQRLFAGDRFGHFLEFHRAHPRVYLLFRDLTRQAFRSRWKIGARCVWENMRWKRLEEIPLGADGFKLNDHHVPYYARLVMLRHEELAGFFSRRDARIDVDDSTLLHEADRIDAARN